MGSFVTTLLLFSFTNYAYSYPLCTNQRAPFAIKSSLPFCEYNGSSCCNNTEDTNIHNQFKAMNVTVPSCASLLKSILCSKCDPFSSELYKVAESAVPRAFPVLCNSTGSATDFCSNVWNQCHNVSISNLPFAIINSMSKTAFCHEFGGSSDDDSACFNGGPVVLNNSETSNSPSGMCLEKMGTGSYLNMVPHPDGSNRAFFANQAGKIWLGTIPEEGSGKTMTIDIDEANPFLDLSDEVHMDTELGMMGIAFHPNFLQNGRFFASFNCDKLKWPRCSGRCSCNSDIRCDPSKLPEDNGAQPCQYHSVVAEYTTNDSTGSQATSVQPIEVRRILTMGLPFSAHHAGQILFGPEDGYLYFMMGDGGSSGDPYNFAQNKKSLLGKIWRLDVDNIPGATEIIEMGLWGNYSVPKDNPYSEDKELQPEIWALGFRNPWRCSFDAERPSYFMCADVGQDTYEEVDIVTKGGNYGWRVYEGPYKYNPPSSPGGNTSVSSISPIFPVMGYNHSQINTAEGSASITGGYFYRSLTDPCLYGRYLYADLYGSTIWAGTEKPMNSGNFTTTKLPVKCAHDSPLQCTSTAGSSFPDLGYIFSFGQGNKKDSFVLASTGVYRVTRPSRCNFACSLENVTSSSGSGSGSGSSSGSASSGERIRFPWEEMHIFVVLFLSGFVLAL